MQISCTPRSQPIPPDKVRPATPVVEIAPLGVAGANAVVSRSTSRQVAPPCAWAMRANESTRTTRITDRPIIMPPAQMA